MMKRLKDYCFWILFGAMFLLAFARQITLGLAEAYKEGNPIIINITGSLQ